ncbi:MAG: DNA-binding protein [Defluviitaleaceae bacterium]|nr:DNA-binding protein [Defluviitaleaceae bacterium]
MENILLDTLLFDYYNPLLTRKQSEIYELYYLQDMSLSEIGQECGITPQAVRDILARTRKNLEKYEDALGIVKKHEMLGELREKLGSILEMDIKNADIAKELKESIDFLSLIIGS